MDELFPAGMLDDMFAAGLALLAELASGEEAWKRSRAECSSALVPADEREERARVNATESPVAEVLLHGPFEAQAVRRPEAVAVVAGGRRLTYRELDRRSNRVARVLSEMGAAPDTLIGVALEKGWEQVVSVLGVLRSGAAFLPIELPLPAERLHYFLKDGGVSIVLTGSDLDQRLPWPAGVRRICVDREVPDDSFPAPRSAPGPGDLAYVIYTSGSTGRPKGVAISHRGAVNTILDINERFGVGPRDRIFALSSLAFDLSVYDIFGALAAGATIVLPEPSGVHDPSHWAEIVRKERVTVWDSVPALMKLYVERVAGRSELCPEALRLVLLSGDWIPVSLPGEIRAMAPEAAVVGLGGATEASIWSILHLTERLDPSCASVPYGKPMKNQTFHVFNEALEAPPAWVPGDLYIGGVGLARGYWRDEEKTRASFLVHPRTGERLYRTGDLGRFLPGAPPWRARSSSRAASGTAS